MKRALDFLGALAGLALLSPLFGLLALIVKLTDGGTVFYKQLRVGLNGNVFTILKFRTMHADAEKDLGPIWAVPNDPRCTRPGAWLRRTGLDELPQLWNILRGDMSFIGPRPERPNFVRDFCGEFKDYDKRHTVRCGLTGYAQVHGWRGYTGIENRLRHDLYYVRNWSLKLDFRIFCLTILHGWRERTRTGF